MLQCINCFFAFFLKTNCEKRKSTKNISLQEWLYFMFEGFLIIFVITMANVKNLFFYFLLPISRESIAFRLNFRSRYFDELTRFEVSWIRKSHFWGGLCVCCVCVCVCYQCNAKRNPIRIFKYGILHLHHMIYSWRNQLRISNSVQKIII